MAFVSSDLSKSSVPYVHQSFPKYVTHATEAPRVVPDDAAWLALGPGWGHPSETAPAPATEAHDDLASAPAPTPRKGKARG